ncbi:MAG: OmpA/MotB family protein [Planctomycetota bacterium]|jgi:chemotaxis protein MotB
MRAANKKTIALVICLVSFTLLSGCVNWEERYRALSVEHENLKGLFERERSEKGQLADRISQDQRTIDELQRQIGDLSRSPADATGFGPGYDVAFDPTAGTITVTLPNAILFDSGKATLKKATSTELDHIRSVLEAKYSSRQIDVVGHTDSDPIKKSKWKDNWELSAQRALTVARYLIERGIANDHIRAVGSGESRPIASNATDSGKKKNRRVEIVVRMR